MPEENISADGQPEVSHVNTPDPEVPVGSVSADGLSLSEINQFLGKNFPTKEAALKSWRDTNSYVGKKTDDIKRDVMAELKANEKTDILARELEDMRKEQFYDRNPKYANPSIRKFIESTGKKPSEVVETPEFKEIFEKVSGYDESQKLKSVLETNPRLASSRDALTKAREIQQANPDPQGAARDEIENLAARAVIDAYDLK